MTVPTDDQYNDGAGIRAETALPNAIRLTGKPLHRVINAEQGPIGWVPGVKSALAGLPSVEQELDPILRPLPTVQPTIPHFTAPPPEAERPWPDLYPDEAILTARERSPLDIITDTATRRSLLGRVADLIEEDMVRSKALG